MPDPEDVKVTRQGVIDTILPENTAVTETDVVVKLKGNKPLEAEVEAISAAPRVSASPSRRRHHAALVGQPTIENHTGRSPM